MLDYYVTLQIYDHLQKLFQIFDKTKAPSILPGTLEHLLNW